MAGERIVRVGNQLFALPAVSEQQATIGAQPAPNYLTDPGEPMGVRRVEELARGLLGGMRDQLFPIEGNVGTGRPMQAPLPGGRSLDMMGALGFAADVPAPGLGTGVRHAGASLAALLLRQQLKKELAEQAGKQVSKKAARRVAEVDDLVEVMVQDNPRASKIIDEIARIRANKKLTARQRDTAIRELESRLGGGSFRPAVVTNRSKDRVRLKFVGVDGTLKRITVGDESVRVAEDGVVKDIIKGDLEDAMRRWAADAEF